MIESIRKFTSSWIAAIILGFAGLALVVTGGFEFRFSGNETVATVGEEEIGAQDLRLAFRLAQFSENPLDQLLAQSGSWQYFLNGLIAQAAARGELDGLGFQAPDDEVIEALRVNFDVGGAFNEGAYETFLRQLGLRATEYEELLRGEIGQTILQAAVSSGVRLPAAPVEAVWRFRGERRSFAYVLVRAADLPEPEAPTDEALAEFIAENQDDYLDPERRRLRVFWLRPEDLADPSAITDAAIEAGYEDRRSEFVTIEARNIEQLVFDDEEAAQEAADRIADGAQFDEILAELGRSVDDVALGYLTFDELAPLNRSVAEAGFAAADGEVVGPVETTAGFALVRVNGLRPAREITLEMARSAIALDLAVEAARGGLDDLANAIEDSRAAGLDLAEIAEAEGARIFEVDVDALGRAPVGAVAPILPPDEDFLSRAFELEADEEIDLIEGEQGGFYVMEVLEITPEAPQSFEDAREAAEAAWRAAERAAAAEAAAGDIEEVVVGAALLEGPIGALSALTTASEARGLTVETLDPVARGEDAGALPAELVQQAFSIAPEDAPGSVSSAPIADGAAIAVMIDVFPADSDAEGADVEIEEMRVSAGSSIAEDVLILYQGELIDRMEAQMFPAAIEAALADGGP